MSLKIILLSMLYEQHKKFDGNKIFTRALLLSALNNKSKDFPENCISVLLYEAVQSFHLIYCPLAITENRIINSNNNNKTVTAMNTIDLFTLFCISVKNIFPCQH